METPAPRRRTDLRVVLWVAGAVVFGLLAWGMSMYWLKRNLSPTVDLLMRERERVKRLEAWVRRAREHKLTFETVLRDPAAALGKPVVWEVRVPTPETASYRGDPAKPVRWTDPAQVQPSDGKGPDGLDFRIVGVVRSTGAAGAVVLEYLGYD